MSLTRDWPIEIRKETVFIAHATSECFVFLIPAASRGALPAAGDNIKSELVSWWTKENFHGDLRVVVASDGTTTTNQSEHLLTLEGLVDVCTLQLGAPLLRCTHLAMPLFCSRKTFPKDPGSFDIWI
ncbi:hypothetical protein Pcinc_039924 [Petrolisthes cinctipes]|uniref:Uncharacterized protein n=1 Tax=Petrolisthes cinctipes TaxID=88211 RepID=A0AAE1BMG1_PETCI|nr:hypothetical protein Pcinc_039924 [Petrolisthes cinctipes]